MPQRTDGPASTSDEQAEDRVQWRLPQCPRCAPPAGPLPALAGPGVPALSLLVLISMVQPVALNMYLPALAQMRVDLNASTSAIQLTLSAFLVAMALGQIMVGPLSDIRGRRIVLLWGIGVFIAGSLVCAAAPNVEVLIAGRVIQALGGCATLALPRAIIRDVHGTDDAASLMGYVTMGIAIAPLVTPVLGGLLCQTLSWRVLFVAMAGFAALTAALTLLRLPETSRRTYDMPAFARFRRETATLLALPAFWLTCTTLAALCVSFFAFMAGGIFVASAVFGLSAAQYGVYFMLAVTGYVLGNFVTGRYGRRIGVVRMIRYGNAISFAGTAIAAGSALAGHMHPLSLFAPMILVSIGNGFALPTTVSAAVSIRPLLAGTAAGLAGAFQVGGGAVASFSVGLLSDAASWAGGRWPVLVPMVVGTALALALSLTLRRRMFV